MAMNRDGSHHKCTLIISPEEWADFCEVSDKHGIPVKTMMMRLMKQLVKQHKDKKPAA